MSTIRVGMMGFGRIGRQIFSVAKQDPAIEMVAVADIGQPEILHHLLTKTHPDCADVKLESNHLVGHNCNTRLLPTRHPGEIPWDMFDIDVVINATGRFAQYDDSLPHLDNGAPRVVIATLPDDQIDRLVLAGVNDDQATVEDRVISVGSPSTSALGMILKVLADKFTIAHASMTSVHAYTSDQSLQDYAGEDYRRSRSGAENIIPNDSPAPFWVAQALPTLAGKLSGYAMNVPVQIGSMLDLTVSFRTDRPDADELNHTFETAAIQHPKLLQVTNDPIVSSDVIGCPQSVLVDLAATMVAGTNLAKLIGWHESLGHAHRIIDIIKHYGALDRALQEAS